MFNRTLFECGFDIHPLWIGSDADTDITGDWVKMTHYERAYALFVKGGSEDVDDLGIEVLQATDASGTGSKALNVSRCWYKTGTLTAAAQGVWTPVSVGDGTPDNFLAFGSSVPTGATRVVADVNTNPLLLLVEILAESFDVSGGFDWWTLFVEGDNVNNAVVTSAFALFAHGAYPQAVPLTPIA